MDQKAHEKLKSRFLSEKKRDSEKPKETELVKSRASEVVGAIEGDEGADFGGEVREFSSESTAEDSPGTKGGSGDQKQTDEEAIQEIRARLLKALPPQHIMVKQIKNSLVGEQRQLNGQMKKLMGNAHRSAFELTKIVAKLRRIRDYFSILAHATYDVIKNLWLKIVHGV